MANPNAPFGFRPVSSAAGGTPRVGKYRIASAYGTAIYKGDAVKLDGAGNIVVATAGDTIIGVFQGCQYVPASTGTPTFGYWPASTTLATGTTCEALVWDDPFQQFEVQGSGALARTEIGQFADLDAGTSGSALTQQSGMALATPSGSEATFRIQEILERPVPTFTNGVYSGSALSTTGSYAIALVEPVAHYKKGSAGGVEV